MSMSINLTMGFVVQNCINAGCGVAFAMTVDEDRARHDDHRVFYCPRGHQHYYGGNSPLEIARKATQAAQVAQRAAEDRERLAWARSNDARHEAHRLGRQVAAQKGQRTKLMRRIAAGVCPCCNRTFADLARHMTGKHPEFQLESGARQRRLSAVGEAGQ